MATALGWYDDETIPEPEPTPEHSGVKPWMLWFSIPAVVVLFGAGLYRFYQTGSCTDCSKRSQEPCEQHEP